MKTDREPGPRDLLSPEELKWTPNTAMEMRFGRSGDARPQRALPPEDDKRTKPVSHVWARKRTEFLFSGAFAVVALLMVIGALYVLDPFGMRVVEATPAAPVAEAPADDAAEDGEARELQGGVKVRKGFGD